jgi:O-acetyl-ADP-ribose deacetylase (regulator of RNase III)
MRQENYGRFRPNDLKRMLLAYFFFLEREITGNEESSYADADFSISELEAMLAEMEPELERTTLQKRRVGELLARINEPAPSPGTANMTRVTAVVGDITQQSDCDAIVNAANTGLRKGGGVCGAIYRAAGSELEISTNEIGPIRVSEAVITPGFHLPNARVIHVEGPRYGTEDDPGGLLVKAMRNVLELADAQGVVRITLPAISMGSFGFPMDQAAPIMNDVARSMATRLKHLREIRFVVFSNDALEHFQTLH